jgi:hypothetical protein
VTLNLSVWILILAAFVAANLPFLNQKFLFLISVGSVKSLKLRLLELALYYSAVGLLAFLLESHLGNRFPYSWELISITACIFIVFAFPGFVFRYLRK